MVEVSEFCGKGIRAAMVKVQSTGHFRPMGSPFFVQDPDDCSPVPTTGESRLVASGHAVSQEGQKRGQTVPLVALKFQHAVFDRSAHPELLFEVGEEVCFSLGVHLKSCHDCHHFSTATGFFKPDHQGRGGGLGNHFQIFSNKRRSPQPLPDFLK